MKNANKQKDVITIVFPQKPGFNLLAHQLMQELMARFNVSVIYRESYENKLTILLNEMDVYFREADVAGRIKLSAVIDAISKHICPVSELKSDELLKSGSVNSAVEDYPDCFCSGE